MELLALLVHKLLVPTGQGMSSMLQAMGAASEQGSLKKSNLRGQPCVGRDYEQASKLSCSGVKEN